MTAHRHDKQRQVQRRSSGLKSVLDPLNRPAMSRKRFDKTPLVSKPKGWGFA